MVDPTTLHDQTVPDLLAAVLGDHAVQVRPPLDTVQVPFWSTRGAQPALVPGSGAADAESCRQRVRVALLGAG